MPEILFKWNNRPVEFHESRYSKYTANGAVYLLKACDTDSTLNGWNFYMRYQHRTSYHKDGQARQ